jgi:DNA replication protein DnaC
VKFLLSRFAAMTPADWEAHDRAVRAEREREEAAAAVERRRRKEASMEIPARALRVLSGALRDTDARRFVQGDATITCLSGNPGTGKTIAACEWLLSREDGLFVTASGLSRIDRALVSRVLKAPALVLDDMGTEYLDPKGFVLSLLDELMDYRYRSLLPLVLTTNLDIESFKARYGARLVDRIRGAGRFVRIGGASMRGEVGSAGALS